MTPSPDRLRPPRLALCLAALLPAGTAVAQATLVVPPRVAAQEANNATAWPFGLNVPSRMQGIYAGRLFGAAALQLRSVAFRPEGRRTAMAKQGVEVELWLSTTAASPWSPAAEFARNQGTDHRLVVKRRKLDLPAVTTTAAPQAFAVELKLDSAFVYDPTKGGLCVELATWAVPAGAYDLDVAYTECPVAVEAAKACGGPVLTIAGALAVPKGTTTHCGAQDRDPWVSFAVAGGPSFGVLLQSFAAAPLAHPVTLPLGGCALHVAPELLVALRLDKDGGATLQVPLGLDLGLAVYATQGLTLDLGFSSLASTATVVGRLGGWEPQARVFAIGKADATTGFVQPGVAWVLRLGS
ncbi:MAG: hypothetical protein R3F30_00035 [Planctomycetota bacterium]